MSYFNAAATTIGNSELFASYSKKCHNHDVFFFFFNSLCSKVVEPETLDLLQKELVITLCLLEQYFLPTFFDIMVHLTIHLVDQVRVCEPVYLLWMYPFERDMKTLKGYVRSRRYSEGCIAECYIAEEALEFSAEYISNYDNIGLPRGCLFDLQSKSQ